MKVIPVNKSNMKGILYAVTRLLKITKKISLKLHLVVRKETLHVKQMTYKKKEAKLMAPTRKLTQNV